MGTVLDFSLQRSLRTVGLDGKAAGRADDRETGSFFDCGAQWR